MARRLLVAGILVIVIAIGFYAYVAHWSLQRSHHGNVIRGVMDTCHGYIESSGKWPASWDQLKATNGSIDWDFAKSICLVDFSLSTADVAEMSVDDFDAIYSRKQSYKPEGSIQLIIELCRRTARETPEQAEQ
jgi:hypothetical protein